MPYDLPADLIAEKNKLSTTGSFLELLEIQLSEAGDTLRYVLNNRTIQWKGHSWIPWPFQPAEVDETSDGDLPTFDLQVSNVGKIIQTYIEEAENGLVGDTVIYRAVHSNYLDQGDNAVYIEETFQILSNKSFVDWVTFPLGAENFFYYRFPGSLFDRKICRYKPTDGFKGSRCKYGGAAISCDYLFSTCLGYGNIANFGAQPGIPGGSFDV